MISKRLASLCRFALVGCLGFVVDATIVFLLVQLLGAEPINARIPAWLLAVSTTYFFNLLFTGLKRPFFFPIFGDFFLFTNMIVFIKFHFIIS